MRKRRILSLLLAVAVMATMLVAVPLTASAESEAAGLKTISESTDIHTSTENYSGLAGNTKLSSDNLLYAKNPSSSSDSINVDGKPYTAGLKVKKQASRSLAIKVASGMIVEVYGTTKADSGVLREIDIIDEANIGDATNTDKILARGTIIDGQNYQLATYTNKTGADQILWIYNKDDKDISIPLIRVIKPDPFLIVEDNVDVVKKDGSIADGKVNYTYTGDAAPNPTFEPDNDKFTVTDDGTAADGQGTATITVDNSANIGDKATITAKATVGGQSYEKKFTVTVVEPSKDITFIASHGIKSVTISGESNAGTEVSQKVEFKRDGKSGACRVHSSTSTSGEATFKAVPYGENYTITYEVEDTYYQSIDSVTGVKVNDSEPTITKVSGNIKSEITEQAQIDDMDIKPATVVTWDFSTTTGAPNEYLMLQGSKANVVSDTQGITIFVDTTNGSEADGKFTACDAKDYVQFRTSATGKTHVYVPVVKGSAVVFEGAADNTIACNDAQTTVSKNTVTYNGEEKKYIEILNNGTSDINLQKIRLIVPPDETTSTDWENLSSDTTGKWATETGDGANKEYTLKYANSISGNGFSYNLLDILTNKPTDLMAAKGIIAVSYDLYLPTGAAPNQNLFIDVSGEQTIAGWSGGQASTYGRFSIAKNDSANTGDIKFVPGQLKTNDSGIFTGKRTNDEYITVTYMLDMKNKKFSASYGSEPAQIANNLTGFATDIKNALYLNVQPAQGDPYDHEVYVKIKNIHADYIEWGAVDRENSTDSGYYMENGTKNGVIRFFQGVPAENVKDYGFYICDSDGNIIESQKAEGKAEATKLAGIYADLIGIPDEETNPTAANAEYKMKAFVTLNSTYEPIYAPEAITGTVDWGTPVTKPE